MTIKPIKSRKSGVKHAKAILGVKAMVMFLPIFRHIQQVYRIGDVSCYLMVIMAYNGSIGVTRACMLYYGYKCGNTYKYTQHWLNRLRIVGLAESVGGKWQLTEKGMRELGLID